MRYAALVLALALSGCSERLVDEPLVPLPNTPPSETAIPRSYVKGPNTLPLGSRASFRSQSVPGAARYEWSVYGEDGVLTLDSPASRITDGTAVGVGEALVEVKAYAADGKLLARGQKRVEAVR